MSMETVLIILVVVLVLGGGGVGILSLARLTALRDVTDVSREGARGARLWAIGRRSRSG